MNKGAGRPIAAVFLAVALVGCGDVDPSQTLSPTSAPVSVAATATPSPQGARLDPEAIASAITEDGLRSQLDALIAVSGAGAGYRAVGSAGYDAAADLVESKLEDAG